MEISEEEQEYLKEVSLLTIKPVIYACNMGEDDFNAGIESNPFYKAVEDIVAAEVGAETLPICAEMEAEIAQLDEDEKAMFLSDMGLESGLDRLIKKSYSLFGSDFLPDRRKAGSACLDHQKRHQGAPGRRQDPHRL